MTHKLIAYEDHIACLGIGNYFSWIIEIEYGMFRVSTHYGKHHGEFDTLRKALRSIDYGFNSGR